MGWLLGLMWSYQLSVGKGITLTSFQASKRTQLSIRHIGVDMYLPAVLSNLTFRLSTPRELSSDLCDSLKKHGLACRMS